MYVSLVQITEHGKYCGHLIEVLRAVIIISILIILVFSLVLLVLFFFIYINLNKTLKIMS